MRVLLRVLLVVVALVGVLALAGVVILITAGEEGFEELGNLGERVLGGRDEGFITATQFRETKRGTSQAAAFRSLGPPANPQALERKPNVQEEPPNATCAYYAERVELGQTGRLFRFCFTRGKLSSKRAF